MIQLLARLFIPGRENVADSKVRSAFGTLCSVCAIVLNVILSGAKFIIGSLAGSVSIAADAINNLTDAGSSILILLGFKFAGAKPRPDRPFGHGRIEYVTGLIVAALVLIAGVEALRGGIQGLLHPSDLDFSWAAVLVLVLSIGVKLYMSLFHRSVGRKINSTALQTAGADCLTDTISTFLALICLLVYKFTGLNLDPWAGILVSLLILKAGAEGGWDTLKQLLGTTPDPETVAQIEQIVMAYPEVIGVHDLVVHDYGPGRLHISLHAEVDGSDDIYRLHDAIDQAMVALDGALGCESVIHMDPVDNQNPLIIQARQELGQLLADIDPALKFHDFRMIPGPTHTNLVFDVLSPVGYGKTAEELTAALNAAWKTAHPEHTYFCVIKLEQSYV